MTSRFIDRNIKKGSKRKLSRKIDKMLVKEPQFKNLRDNKEITLKTLDKYRRRLRRGKPVSSLMVKREMIKLRRNRRDLDLSKSDLKDLKTLISSMKSK